MRLISNSVSNRTFTLIKAISGGNSGEDKSFDRCIVCESPGKSEERGEVFAHDKCWKQLSLNYTGYLHDIYSTSLCGTSIEIMSPEDFKTINS